MTGMYPGGRGEGCIKEEEGREVSMRERGQGGIEEGEHRAVLRMERVGMYRGGRGRGCFNEGGAMCVFNGNKYTVS